MANEFICQVQSADGATVVESVRHPLDAVRTQQWLSVQTAEAAAGERIVIIAQAAGGVVPAGWPAPVSLRGPQGPAGPPGPAGAGSGAGGGTGTGTGAVVRYEDTNPAFAYSGGWIDNPNGASSAGTTRYTAGEGESVTLSFTGTRAKLFGAPRGVDIARVIDGGAPVNLPRTGGGGYDPAQFDDTGILPYGAHAITWTNRFGGAFILDYVEVTE